MMARSQTGYDSTRILVVQQRLKNFEVLYKCKELLQLSHISLMSKTLLSISSNTEMVSFEGKKVFCLGITKFR
jgi:hypothetical protein